MTCCTPYNIYNYLRYCYPEIDNKIQILSVENILEQKYIDQILNDTYVVVGSEKYHAVLSVTIFMEIEFDDFISYTWPEITYRIIH